MKAEKLICCFMFAALILSILALFLAGITLDHWPINEEKEILNRAYLDLGTECGFVKILTNNTKIF